MRQIEQLIKEEENGFFEKANWDKFEELCEEKMVAIDSKEDIDIFNEKVCAVILEAALESIPKSKGKMTRKAVPWWTEKCSKVVKDRNKAFKLLKRTHNYNHLILFKKAQALVRRTIRQAKRESWNVFFVVELEEQLQ